MPRITRGMMRRAWIVSGGVAASLVVVSLILGFQANGVATVDDFIVLGIVLVITPPAVLDYLDKQWKRSNDRYVPNLLLDVATAQQSGMTFTKALEVSATRDYGSLSKNLKKAVAKISWGIPYEEALDKMAQDVDTRLVRMSMTLINETGRMGGNIQYVMSLIANHVKELEDLESERITQTRPYIFIVYIGFGILLLSIAAVYLMFLKPFIPEMQGMMFAAPLELEVYRRILFHTTIIQGLFAGLLAGALSEGSIGAGLKHA
ncbi:MAG: type II secretion system F family protein, partial [Candidatus Bathyarchaeia archaeon]